jgi:hypothetical protein
MTTTFGDAGRGLERTDLDGPIMRDPPNAPVATHAGRPRATSSGLLARLEGPGGYYNIGNAVALSSGILVQAMNAPDAEGGLSSAVLTYLVGSSGAAWLTVAMLVFFASGEAYHRAWAGRHVPDARLNRLGDLLSGIGALALTAALVDFGDVAMAAVAGTLLAGGKFGSAVLPAAANRSSFPWSSVLRSAVVLSRFPSLAALGLELLRLAQSSGPAADAVMPAVMFFCFLLWLWADVLLLNGPESGESGRASRGDSDR